MSTYQFDIILPAGRGFAYRKNVYRIDFIAIVQPKSAGKSEFTLSFDAFNHVEHSQIQIKDLPKTLFDARTAEHFSHDIDDDEPDDQIGVRLDLNTATEKAIALNIVEQLLSFKDIGGETPKAAFITGLASKLDPQHITDIDGTFISSPPITIKQKLFALYQELDGTKTIEDFKTQTLTQPQAISLAASHSPSLFSTSSSNREHKPKSSCCLVM